MKEKSCGPTRLLASVAFSPDFESSSVASGSSL
eukprot:CAMPEP_0181526042 /NCGR_PEP_ID=MMETSP1110-20121109/69280_1 /TAXON_ID=174948 /ORGANISM="Symbiodinium sp., Strain CCMP421" /LENGTH=32 /DNA_ID= /DNA_START= /DNA_END= /DNA_ORIENTATION=